MAVCVRAGLTRLDLSAPGSRRDEALTDAGVGALAPLAGLRSLNLAGHSELTSEGLSLLSSCTALTALDLSGALPVFNLPVCSLCLAAVHAHLLTVIGK